MKSLKNVKEEVTMLKMLQGVENVVALLDDSIVGSVFLLRVSVFGFFSELLFLSFWRATSFTFYVSQALRLRPEFVPPYLTKLRRSKVNARVRVHAL